MKKNIKKQYKRHFIISTLTVIAIVVLFNILAFTIFYRFDLTQNKDYSLSDASKTVLKNLDEKVKIDIYFSEELPPEYLNVRQNIKDLLAEYENYAQGNLKISYIDPKDDEDLKAELLQKGIPELQFNVLKKDQVQLTTGYLAIEISYLDKEEILPVVDSISNFEYDLTSSIKKVSSDEISKIAWARLTSLEENDQTNIFSQEILNKKYSEVIKEIKNNYELDEIDLSQGKLLDNDYKTLVVAGFEEDFDDKSKYVVDQFLMQGGSVLFLLDGVKVDNYLKAEANNNSFTEMLNNYGLNLKQNLILDKSNETASFGGGFMNFMVPYPFWVKIDKNGFSTDNVAVSQLESLVLPWTSNIEINKETIKNNEVIKLVQSSSNSWASEDSFDLNPQQNFTNQNFSQYNLAVAVTGNFESYFKDKDNPLEESSEEKNDSSEEARLVVVGDADFVSDNFIGQYPSNYLFLANVVDWLNQDEALIAIRSKSVTDRNLKELDENKKSLIKYLNIFGVTVLVIILGLTRFAIRNKKFKKIKLSLK